MTKTCKYCNALMNAEHYTDLHDDRKYTAFFVCPRCYAVMDGEYIRIKGQDQIISEKWMESKEGQGNGESRNK